MGINDTLWGGGKLYASSPEAGSPIPPSQDEMDRFIESAQRNLRGLPVQLTLELDFVQV